jgi:hypothetical protein
MKKYALLGNGNLWDILRSQIYVAPRSIFNRFNPEEATDEDVEQGVDDAFSVKLHHKLFRSGDATTLGSSFNPSAAAEHNNEIAWILVHRSAANYAEGIIRWLISQTNEEETVIDEAIRRNRWAGYESDFQSPSQVLVGQSCEDLLKD